MILGLLAFIAGCSKEKAPEIKTEIASEKFETASNEKDVTGEPTKKSSDGKGEVIDLGNGVNLDLVLIPAGKFKMGSNMIAIDPFSNIKVKQPPSNEVPRHEVTITKPFYIGKYEITQEQWFEIMGNNPSSYKGRKLPVTDVSWGGCQEFIKKLNVKTNGGYRLPTEAEWEYACRAGTNTAYSYGDKITYKDANIKNPKQAKIGNPVEVGSYKPNAFGLFDMHGNVNELCQDWYGEYPAEAVTDPKGQDGGYGRVLRGGSFEQFDSNARSSFRGSYDESRKSGYSHIEGTMRGFRLARTP